MVVETLGDAFAAGWRLTARCAWGKREGMKTKRECTYTRELDLETLVWTNFPLSSLDGRLMCPRCRSRRVAVLFQPPPTASAARLVDGRCSRFQGSLADASRNASGRTARPSGRVTGSKPRGSDGNLHNREGVELMSGQPHHPPSPPVLGRTDLGRSESCALFICLKDSVVTPPMTNVAPLIRFPPVPTFDRPARELFATPGFPDREPSWPALHTAVP
jgi:hypothetical protein